MNNGDVANLLTEIVYSIGGNAYKKSSIKKIFKLKGRPKIKSTIIHYNLDKAKNDIVLNDYFLKLYKNFCPGPITFVLKKRLNLKLASCFQLKTIKGRFSNIRSLSILKITFPLAKQVQINQQS